MRFSFVPFFLLVIPILEITAFIIIGNQIGLWATLLMILLTAILGSILLRIQGFQILSRINEATSRGELPGKELGDGAMILVAGVLLLTPGFITDTMGFLLFIPAVRTAIWRMIRSKIQIITPGGGQFSRGQGDPFGGNDYSGGAQRDFPNQSGVVDLEPDEFHETTPKKPSDGKSPWRK